MNAKSARDKIVPRASAARWPRRRRLWWWRCRSLRARAAPSLTRPSRISSRADQGREWGRRNLTSRDEEAIEATGRRNEDVLEKKQKRRRESNINTTLGFLRKRKRRKRERRIAWWKLTGGALVMESRSSLDALRDSCDGGWRRNRPV